MFTLYVPDSRPKSLNRTDALLAAILAQLKGGSGNPFSVDNAAALGSGADWVTGTRTIAVARTQFLFNNPKRMGFLCSSNATTISIFPTPTNTATFGLLAGPNVVMEITRTRHGSVVGSDWYVFPSAGGNFAWLEVFK